MRKKLSHQIEAHWAEQRRVCRLREREFHIKQWEIRRLNETREFADRFRNGMGAASFKNDHCTPRTRRLARSLIRALHRDNMPRIGDWECNAALLFRTREKAAAAQCIRRGA